MSLEVSKELSRCTGKGAGRKMDKDGNIVRDANSFGMQWTVWSSSPDLRGLRESGLCKNSSWQRPLSGLVKISLH